MTLFEASLNHSFKHHPGLLWIHHSVVMANSLEQHHFSPSINPTNGETLKWYENLSKNGDVTETKLKTEAEVFSKKRLRKTKRHLKRKF